MPSLNEEGDTVPEYVSIDHEQQKTYRTLILCAGVLLGWFIWNIRGCDHERTEQMRLEKLNDKHS